MKNYRVIELSSADVRELLVKGAVNSQSIPMPDMAVVTIVGFDQNNRSMFCPSTIIIKIPLDEPVQDLDNEEEEE